MIIDQEGYENLVVLAGFALMHLTNKKLDKRIRKELLQATGWAKMQIDNYDGDSAWKSK